MSLVYLKSDGARAALYQCIGGRADIKHCTYGPLREPAISGTVEGVCFQYKRQKSVPQHALKRRLIRSVGIQIAMQIVQRDTAVLVAIAMCFHYFLKGQNMRSDITLQFI